MWAWSLIHAPGKDQSESNQTCDFVFMHAKCLIKHVIFISQKVADFIILLQSQLL